jgi:hypothetical protein
VLAVVFPFSRAVDMKEDNCRGSARSKGPRVPVKDAGFTTRGTFALHIRPAVGVFIAPEIRHVYEKHATTCDYFLGACEQSDLARLSVTGSLLPASLKLHP